MFCKTDLVWVITYIRNIIWLLQKATTYHAKSMKDMGKCQITSPVVQPTAAASLYLKLNMHINCMCTFKREYDNGYWVSLLIIIWGIFSDTIINCILNTHSFNWINIYYISESKYNVLVVMNCHESRCPKIKGFHF